MEHELQRPRLDQRDRLLELPTAPRRVRDRQLVRPVLSLFTRFRPYLAHFPPVFSRFLRVFTASPRRFQRATSRNPKPRNSRQEDQEGRTPPFVRHPRCRGKDQLGGYRELAALAVRMSSPSSSLSLRAARLLGGGCPRRALWPPSSDVSSSASSGSDVSAASAPLLGPQSAMCSRTRPRIPSVSCGSRAR